MLNTSDNHMPPFHMLQFMSYHSLPSIKTQLSKSIPGTSNL